MNSYQNNESQEDYLECILMLNRKMGFCRSVDVSNELGVTRPSVSVAVSKLQANGFLWMDDEHLLHLTEIGEQAARRIYDKHLALKGILKKIGVDSELAEKEACRMEHILSDDSILKLKAAIEK